MSYDSGVKIIYPRSAACYVRNQLKKQYNNTKLNKGFCTILSVGLPIVTNVPIPTK